MMLNLIKPLPVFLSLAAIAVGQEGSSAPGHRPPAPEAIAFEALVARCAGFRSARRRSGSQKVSD